MPGTVSIAEEASLGRRVTGRVAGFVALTKPRIIELLLVTTVPAMIVAARGWPRWSLILTTLVGGTLAAGGANAINMFVDRDIDAVMHRTRGRPLVTGAVSPVAALVFALCLEVAAFAELWVTVNPLSAVLAIGAMLFYVFVYTLWLKRTSTQNVVIGGAAGAVPVLVGWAAVRDSVGWAPIVLFVLMFVWTPPHFWALAIKYRDDYRSVHVPMLPALPPWNGPPDASSATRCSWWRCHSCSLGPRGWDGSIGSALRCWARCSVRWHSTCCGARRRVPPCDCSNGRSPT